MVKKIYLLLLISLFATVRGWAQCTPTVGLTGATSDYINSFTFGGLSNLNSGDNPLDYQLYPQTGTYVQGLTYPYSITIGATFGQWVGMWIDYNGNNLFTDPGEFVYFSATGIAANSIASGNITKPLTATPGTRRLRVAVMYSGGPMTQAQACGHGSYGEYEDYNITILANTPCAGTPTAGTSTANPANPCPGVSVSLGLTGNSLVGNLAYQWISSTTNAAPWTVIAGATTLPYNVFPPAGVTTYYRCIVTCTNPGGGADTSAAVPVTVQSWSPT